MSHLLTERAMLVALSIGVWQGYRLDKEASAEITAAKGAKSDAARVNKHLVAKEALAPVVTAMGNIRTHFYTKTLPWRDNGDRILTRKMFLDFVPAHETLVNEFNDAVETFLTVAYPQAIEQAQFRMGDLFKREDYPPASELRRRFYATLDISPVSSSGDFRVAIDDEHADRIRAQIDAAAEARLAAAQAEIWSRIGQTVGYFQQRLADPKAVFRDTTVTNLHELIKLVPGLNVLDDPEIENVRQLIEKMAGNVTPGEIRKNPDVREELAGEAQEILDKMSGIMRAFGQEAA